MTEKEVCLWLQDDLLLCWVLPPKGKGHRQHPQGKRKREENEGQESEGEELELELALAQQLETTSSGALPLENVDSDGEE